MPWDFECALKDKFDTTVEVRQRDIEYPPNQYPLINKMERTELKKEDEDEIKELAKNLVGTLWQDGLFDSPTMGEAQKIEFFDLGQKILTDEGFLLFYQG